MWVWSDKITPDWMQEYAVRWFSQILYPRQLFRMYSWIYYCRGSVSATDPHNRSLVTRCLQWSWKVLGPLWITNSGLHFKPAALKQMSPMHYTGFILNITDIKNECKNEIISVSRAWDKEQLWVPDRIRTYDLPDTGRALYSLELRRTHGERGHILGSYLTRVLHTARISNVDVALRGERNERW